MEDVGVMCVLLLFGITVSELKGLKSVGRF